MTSLKERLWKEHRISSEDATWHKRGAVITTRTIQDPNEIARSVADKTGCDVIHLSESKLLIEGFA